MDTNVVNLQTKQYKILKKKWKQSTQTRESGWGLSDVWIVVFISCLVAFMVYWLNPDLFFEDPNNKPLTNNYYRRRIPDEDENEEDDVIDAPKIGIPVGTWTGTISVNTTRYNVKNPIDIEMKVDTDASIQSTTRHHTQIVDDDGNIYPIDYLVGDELPLETLPYQIITERVYFDQFNGSALVKFIAPDKYLFYIEILFIWDPTIQQIYVFGQGEYGFATVGFLTLKEPTVDIPQQIPPSALYQNYPRPGYYASNGIIDVFEKESQSYSTTPWTAVVQIGEMGKVIDSFYTTNVIEAAMMHFPDEDIQSGSGSKQAFNPISRTCTISYQGSFQNTITKKVELNKPVGHIRWVWDSKSKCLWPKANFLVRGALTWRGENGLGDDFVALVPHKLSTLTNEYPDGIWIGLLSDLSSSNFGIYVYIQVIITKGYIVKAALLSSTRENKFPDRIVNESPNGNTLPGKFLYDRRTSESSTFFMDFGDLDHLGYELTLHSKNDTVLPFLLDGILYVSGYNKQNKSQQLRPFLCLLYQQTGSLKIIDDDKILSPVNTILNPGYQGGDDDDDDPSDPDDSGGGGIISTLDGIGDDGNNIVGTVISTFDFQGHSGHSIYSGRVLSGCFQYSKPLEEGIPVKYGNSFRCWVYISFKKMQVETDPLTINQNWLFCNGMRLRMQNSTTSRILSLDPSNPSIIHYVDDDASVGNEEVVVTSLKWSFDPTSNFIFCQVLDPTQTQLTESMRKYTIEGDNIRFVPGLLNSSTSSSPSPQVSWLIEDDSRQSELGILDGSKGIMNMTMENAVLFLCMNGHRIIDYWYYNGSVTEFADITTFNRTNNTYPFDIREHQLEVALPPLANTDSPLFNVQMVTQGYEGYLNVRFVINGLTKAWLYQTIPFTPMSITLP